MRDTFTTTVDGAAAFERMYGEEHYEDGPDLSDVADDERAPWRPMCQVTRTNPDGTVTHCRLRVHGSETQHEPDPWVMRPGQALWDAEPPF